MKKSYFMRSLNLTIFLFITASLALVLGVSAKFIISSLAKNDMVFIQQVLNIVKQISRCLVRIGLLGTGVVVLIITIELVHRFKSDKIINYFKSVYSTVLFRRFLTQTERTERVFTIETQTATTYNLINRTFNLAVNKCIVDIHQDSVIIFIKNPNNQQAQKLLKEMESQIKEEIANRNPNYYFSAPTRVKNALWFEGKKR
ncbi:TPA: hypothetical protein IUD63_001794 [Enterococcus faecalis]|nr:hypothetical protein [Enterococcus faecalis]HAP3473081.1 hypothetical protein [Enterococcus faecalis]HAP3476070.1 hypothetical protein [Enterococcus faecalis]HAP3478971.1 hypothetical protein [Enterococcus faecalis]HAP3481923.1 hypothetical protein [Enterococcus faecalis]